MWQGYRRGFTAAEKTELWDRWQRGESLKAIGRAFGKPSSSIYCQLAPHGGVRPAPRRRSRLALTFSEREEISRGSAAHRSARSMARLLGRSASTVSRELSRNGGHDRYRAARAAGDDEKALSLFAIAAHRNPTDGQIQALIAQVYTRRGKLKEATNSLVEAKRLAYSGISATQPRRSKH